MKQVEMKMKNKPASNPKILRILKNLREFFVFLFFKNLTMCRSLRWSETTTTCCSMVRGASQCCRYRFAACPALPPVLAPVLRLVEKRENEKKKMRKIMQEKKKKKKNLHLPQPTGNPLASTGPSTSRSLRGRVWTDAPVLTWTLNIALYIPMSSGPTLRPSSVPSSSSCCRAIQSGIPFPVRNRAHSSVNELQLCSNRW
jgi:hypothetical protein